MVQGIGRHQPAARPEKTGKLQYENTSARFYPQHSSSMPEDGKIGFSFARGVSILITSVYKSDKPDKFSPASLGAYA